jgi:hypothetical protein
LSRVSQTLEKFLISRAEDFPRTLDTSLLNVDPFVSELDSSQYRFVFRAFQLFREPDDHGVVVSVES